MLLRLSLRAKVSLILAAMVIITISGGLFLVWYTYKMEGILASIADHYLLSYETAEGLEIALANQKGFVSYYLIDGDADWLRQLGIYRQIFSDRLKDAYNFAEEAQEMKAVQNIETKYKQYINAKDRVINFYKNGKKEEGAKLHKSVRNDFFIILELCEQYKAVQIKKIANVKDSSRSQAEKFRVIAGAAVLAGVFLAVLLSFVLIYSILEPIRNLTVRADREGKGDQADNEIKALSKSINGLIQDADQTYSELIKSREHLLQAEKLALVGKLAAGVAHSIRNPFTSVKMRLFSLSRSLELSPYQKEDFDVISEEIRHIDTIVQNFLEFSRRPKLKMQTISPSTVVDLAIQLLEHRLKSYDVKVKVMRDKLLPEIQVDPEQLKEVIVNLIVNACEAMEKGGLIVINEETIKNEKGEFFAIIRVKDNGPGIPEEIIEKILQPFFTTKEEGTGLGLSIATKIVEEHDGKLEVNSREGEGATFIITLPLRESQYE